ncbi:HNH endonuclease, partial [Patescibacteria group bacterium]|nr:HNH endonuclease [Patescibacteria group bacterium]
GRTHTLTIAHIVPPKRKKGRNASSYKVDDCKTLCVECHQTEDKALNDLRAGNKIVIN